MPLRNLLKTNSNKSSTISLLLRVLL